MRIHQLTLRSFRGFSALNFDLHPRCTVLAGVNGSGKSSTLDGLAVAIGSWFLGFDEVAPRSILPEEIHRERFTRDGHVDLEPQFPVRVEVRGSFSDREVCWARELRKAGGYTTHGEAAELRDMAAGVQKAVQRGEPVDLPVLAYYGSGRLWVQRRASQSKRGGLTSRTHGYDDCLNPASNHKLFEWWMKHREQARVQRLSMAAAAAAKQDPVRTSLDAPALAAEAAAAAVDVQLEAVSKAAAGCVEGGCGFRFDVAADELRLTFMDGSEQSFERLSDGYRSLIALAADIAWRAVRLNPHHGITAPADAKGVILIDEIELHLHPAWQRTVLKRLVETFPGLQFIVTTHSPQVLASVEAACVRFFDIDGQVHPATVAEGLDTNTVLRDLMGVPERPPEFAERITEVASHIDRREFVRARRLLDELSGILGGDDPTITALEWELADARSGVVEGR